MAAQGVWVNEYGSEMALAVHSDGSVTGTYESTTGSTGKYLVVGHQQARDPTLNGGQALALAIGWRSISAGPRDASWHWCSGLSGQISVQDGAETMVLAHALVVTDPFPGLVPIGVYVDKLTYRRIVRHAEPLDVQDTRASVADPLTGLWRSADGTDLDLTVTPHVSGEFGRVSGTMRGKSVAANILGVTDVSAHSAGLRLQSIVLTANIVPTGLLVSLSGSLDLEKRILTLIEFSSRSTVPGETYLQTTLSTKTFEKN